VDGLQVLAISTFSPPVKDPDCSHHHNSGVYCPLLEVIYGEPADAALLISVIFSKLRLLHRVLLIRQQNSLLAVHIALIVMVESLAPCWRWWGWIRLPGMQPADTNWIFTDTYRKAMQIIAAVLCTLQIPMFSSLLSGWIHTSHPT